MRWATKIGAPEDEKQCSAMTVQLIFLRSTTQHRSTEPCFQSAVPRNLPKLATGLPAHLLDGRSHGLPRHHDVLHQRPRGRVGRDRIRVGRFRRLHRHLDKHGARVYDQNILRNILKQLHDKTIDTN